MNVIIGINNSERIALDKEITVLASLNGILRDGSSLKNPNILIECDVSQIANANYMEIPDFGRSYFITEKESVTNSLFLVTARCDVLTSYASQIRLNTAIVHKQENDWNLIWSVKFRRKCFKIWKQKLRGIPCE